MTGKGRHLSYSSVLINIIHLTGRRQKEWWSDLIRTARIRSDVCVSHWRLFSLEHGIFVAEKLIIRWAKSSSSKIQFRREVFRVIWLQKRVFQLKWYKLHHYNTTGLQPVGSQTFDVHTNWHWISKHFRLKFIFNSSEPSYCRSS